MHLFKRKPDREVKPSGAQSNRTPPTRPAPVDDALRVHRMLGNQGMLQRKLTVNTPGDAYEQEADRVADEVMRLQKAQVQRQNNTAADSAASDAPPSVYRTLQTSGHPLDADTRTFMESRFGQDFGDVRVHTDPQAAQSAADVNARAYTVGNDVVFGAGQYDPHTTAGQGLIAHELTHTLQQTGMVQRQDEGGDDEEPFSFDFEVLPPEIQFRLGSLMLQADTGSTELQFTNNLIQYRLGYSYGSDIFLGASSGGYSSRLGVNPSSGNFSLNLTQDQFRFGGSVNPFTGGAGFSLGYGSSLLPMLMPPLGSSILPNLSDQVYAGAAGVHGVLGGLGSFNDPLSFYNAQSDNIDAIMPMVKSLSAIQGAQPGFGAGLTFTYSPQSGALFHAGMQWIF